MSEESRDLTEIQFSEQVQKADQYSKVAALGVAMALFAASYWATAEPQFSSIVAAMAGIGTRFFIPYQVSLSVPEEKRVSIKDHPATGDFHHGAAGIGLVVGSVAAVGLLIGPLVSEFSLVVGGVIACMCYILLGDYLPRL